MSYSMTGFAQAEGKYKDKEISVEIRSLNSKFMDLRLKIPFLYRAKEHDIRKLVQSIIRRGKVEISIILNGMSDSENYAINKDQFKKFYYQLDALNKELKMDQVDIMQSILRIPNVIGLENHQLINEEWEAVSKVVLQAIHNLNDVKRKEGEVLAAEISSHITNIAGLLEKVYPLEAIRMDTIKSRITKDLEDISNYHPLDKNRFEQEVIYYLEKLDITEEKVRLKQHCEYFLEVIGIDKFDKGKKLSFISQEIGREINTLGAKAQSSDIQKIVVDMKDELEKIKEQLANVQ